MSQEIQKMEAELQNKLTPRSFGFLKIKSRSIGRWALSLALGGVVAGVNWYFQSVIAHHDNERQRQLIERVNNDQTATDFLQNFDYNKADDWECKKITIDGSLKEGRFLVKRNRGNEEGYIVLAPFTVQRDKAFSSKRKVERKFVLNMGWIPKNSKHLVKTLAATDAIGENQYTAENRIEAMEKQAIDNLYRDPKNVTNISTITTVEAYVRRGEEREILNGLNNWRDQKLYKFIDLPWLSRLFRIPNEAESSTIYLERAPKNEEETEVVPIPTNKQHVIEDLKERIEMNNKNKERNVKVVGAGSIAAALLLSLL